MKSDNHEINQRSNLFLLLNEEINNINNDQQKSGWTQWALLAALSTIFWVLINQLEKGNFDLIQLQQILIVLTFSYFLLKNLYAVFSIKSSNLDNLRYYYGHEIFSKLKGPLLVSFIWNLIILFFIINNKDQLSKIPLFLSYFIIAFNIGGFFNSFIINRNKMIIFPIDPINGEISSTFIKWCVRIISFAVIGIIIYSGFEWLKISNENNSFQIDVLKIAFLIVGIVIVTYLIFSQSPRSNLLKTLVLIRRDLALTNKSNEEILKEIDEAINGHKLENYFSTDLLELDYYNKLFEKELKQITQDLKEIKEGNELKNLFTEQKKDSIFKSLVFASTIEFDQIEKRLKKIKIKEKFFKVIATNNQTDQFQLGNILKRNSILVENYNSVVKEYFQLIKETDGDNSAENMIRELMKYVPKLEFSETTGENIV